MKFRCNAWMKKKRQHTAEKKKLTHNLYLVTINIHFWANMYSYIYVMFCVCFCCSLVNISEFYDDFSSCSFIASTKEKFVTMSGNFYGCSLVMLFSAKTFQNVQWSCSYYDEGNGKLWLKVNRSASFLIKTFKEWWKFTWIFWWNHL